MRSHVTSLQNVEGRHCTGPGNRLNKKLGFGHLRQGNGGTWFRVQTLFGCRAPGEGRGSDCNAAQGGRGSQATAEGPTRPLRCTDTGHGVPTDTHGVVIATKLLALICTIGCVPESAP